MSYARLDGEEVAGQLRAELERLEVAVWFDHVAIVPGKSQALQMDQGLRKAESGIALLTPAYLAGRFWTERELGALLAKSTLIRRAEPGPGFTTARDSVAKMACELTGRCDVGATARWADEVVEDLGHARAGKSCVALAVEQIPHPRARRLALEQRQHCVGIENDRPVLRRSVARSSARARRRASLVDGPLPRYLPPSAPTGSSGIGRTTTRSPRSTTMTRSACHRERASAGIDACPFADTFIT